MIHSYDYPPIAKHGVEAAKKYATIAPDSPHALHMPSHIFTRLGYWRESIEANRASSRVASEATFDGHHAHDYLVYAHLQLAQDRAAREAMERSRSMKPVDNFAAAYAYAAMPARLALERNDWKEAAELPLTPAADAYPWKQYPQSEAVNAFARAIGAALSGNAAATKEQQARILALRDAAKAAKLAYWIEQIDIQGDIAGSLALCAEGKPEVCIEGMRKGRRPRGRDRKARRDARADHPGPRVARRPPARLWQGRRRAAGIRGGLEKEPNRYRAVLGAARAASRAGNESRARELFKHFADLGKDADSVRDGLEEARRIAGRG